MFFAGQAKQAYSNYSSSTKFSTILVVLNLVPWYWLPVVRALVLGLTRISLIKNLEIYLLGRWIENRQKILCMFIHNSTNTFAS